MERQLEIVGVILILLALSHIAFPRYFDWQNDLRPLSLINRQMMHVHTFFIALAVMLMGVLCLTSPTELVQAPLGRRIALGLAFFWMTRLVVQFFGYSPVLWRGKRFETTLHVVFSLLWTYLSLVFLGVYFRW